MVFCTSCGKEVSPGVKFCENCGTPVEQTPVSPAPSAIPSVPVPIAKKPPASARTLVIVAVAGIICLIAAAWFVGLPLLKGPQPAVTATGVSGTPTPVVPNFADPTTTVVPVTTTLPPAVPATPVQHTEDRYETSYEQIYTLDQAFSGGQKLSYNHQLTRPPLYIKFTVTPGMVSREKVDPSSGQMVNATYANPNAWFEVKVIDVATGTMEDARGFNRQYSGMTKQEFMIRNSGNYRVEMSGNDVTAHIEILIGNS
jgi:hypothetical protein